MNLGGGSLLLEGDKNWFGVGHNAVATFNDNDYFVFHAYDAHDNGKSKLRFEKLIWLNGGPLCQERGLIEMFTSKIETFC
jgi:arabinan endo-1,5-alpha-L-arabinosidase